MNDLAFGVSPNDVIAAYRAIIDKAHSKGLKAHAASSPTTTRPLGTRCPQICGRTLPGETDSKT
ncbi:hypothetical protein [Nocardia xishanensis]|uniref:Uncharacterized protein n=1 Tax=Nocardia xishanensis TaxID=238964 RepID=A0ABW7WU79_9NOCA